MSEDRLLHDLGRLARERRNAENARFDERWDRLSAGTLTPEEETELLALAEKSPEAREVYEAFRPLGPEFQARVVQSIREQGPAAVEPVKPPGKLLRWPRLARRVTGWSVAAAAAAAALAVVLRPQEPLPAYALAEITGASAMRGEAAAAIDFAPGDRFRILLRPETGVAWAKLLRARAFLLQGRELRRLEIESRVEPNGVVILEGSLDRALPAGTWTLWAVVGRWGKLPDPEDLLSESAQAPVHRRDWAAVPQDIRIRAP